MTSCPGLLNFKINNLIEDPIFQGQGEQLHLFMTMSIQDFISEVSVIFNISGLVMNDWIGFISIDSTGKGIFINLLRHVYPELIITKIAGSPGIEDILNNINLAISSLSSGTTSFNFKDIIKQIYGTTNLENRFYLYFLFLFIYILNSIIYASAYKSYLNKNTPDNQFIETVQNIDPVSGNITYSYTTKPFSTDQIISWLEWLSIKSIRLIYSESGSTVQPPPLDIPDLISKMNKANDSTDYYTNVAITMRQQFIVMFDYLNAFRQTAITNPTTLTNVDNLISNDGTASNLYAAFGYSTNYSNTITTARDLLEHLTPTTQCNNTIGKFVENQPCYICGFCIVNKAECEHILPVSMACKHLCLYILNSKSTLTPAQLNMLVNIKLEYKWAHRCCNQLKSNDINFIILDTTVIPRKYKFNNKDCDEMWKRLQKGLKDNKDGNEICSDYYNFSCSFDVNGATGKQKASFFDDDYNKTTWCSDLMKRLEPIITFLNKTENNIVCNPQCCDNKGNSHISNIYLYRLLQYQKSLIMMKLSWNNIFGGTPAVKSLSFVKRFVSSMLSKYSDDVSESLNDSANNYFTSPPTTITNEIINLLYYGICNCVLIYLASAYIYFNTINIPYSLEPKTTSYRFLFISIAINTSLYSDVSVLKYLIRMCKGKFNDSDPLKIQLPSNVLDFIKQLFINAKFNLNIDYTKDPPRNCNLSIYDLSKHNIKYSDAQLVNTYYTITEFAQLCDILFDPSIEDESFKYLLYLNRLLNMSINQRSNTIGFAYISKQILEHYKKLSRQKNPKLEKQYSFATRLYVYLYQLMQGYIPFLLNNFIDLSSSSSTPITMNDWLKKMGSLYNNEGKLINNSVSDNLKIFYPIPFSIKVVDWNKVYDEINSENTDTSTSVTIFRKLLEFVGVTETFVNGFNSSSSISASGKELIYGGRSRQRNIIMKGGSKFLYENEFVEDLRNNTGYFDGLSNANNIEIVKYFEILDGFLDICGQTDFVSQNLCSFIKSYLCEKYVRCNEDIQMLQIIGTLKKMIILENISKFYNLLEINDIINLLKNPLTILYYIGNYLQYSQAASQLMTQLITGENIIEDLYRQINSDLSIYYEENQQSADFKKIETIGLLLNDVYINYKRDGIPILQYMNFITLTQNIANHVYRLKFLIILINLYEYCNIRSESDYCKFYKYYLLSEIETFIKNIYPDDDYKLNIMFLLSKLNDRQIETSQLIDIYVFLQDLFGNIDFEGNIEDFLKKINYKSFVKLNRELLNNIINIYRYNNEYEQFIVLALNESFASIIASIIASIGGIPQDKDIFQFIFDIINMYSDNSIELLKIHELLKRLYTFLNEKIKVTGLLESIQQYHNPMTEQIITVAFDQLFRSIGVSVPQIPQPEQIYEYIKNLIIQSDPAQFQIINDILQQLSVQLNEKIINIELLDSIQKNHNPMTEQIITVAFDQLFRSIGVSVPQIPQPEQIYEYIKNLIIQSDPAQFQIINDILQQLSVQLKEIYKNMILQYTQSIHSYCMTIFYDESYHKEKCNSMITEIITYLDTIFGENIGNQIREDPSILRDFYVRLSQYLQIKMDTMRIEDIIVLYHFLYDHIENRYHIITRGRRGGYTKKNKKSHKRKIKMSNRRKMIRSIRNKRKKTIKYRK